MSNVSHTNLILLINYHGFRNPPKNISQENLFFNVLQSLNQLGQINVGTFSGIQNRDVPRGTAGDWNGQCFSIVSASVGTTSKCVQPIRLVSGWSLGSIVQCAAAPFTPPEAVTWKGIKIHFSFLPCRFPVARNNAHGSVLRKPTKHAKNCTENKNTATTVKFQPENNEHIY